eukprot:GFYU01002171.1.p1 GENE.GFYU01002171.1~~GFYU01002171.1.p1  ORF type:complete len:396 (-),score=145.13 GFYU01002171.1:208-1395(-)
MVLEATMICVDNSDWMRNGDYIPNRMVAQNDAVRIIAHAKAQSNAENTVGVMTMSGKCETLITPTPDVHRVQDILDEIDLGGSANILVALQVAQLALKHRQNKNQRQRIVLFVGSPLECKQEDLVKLGKKLKKNNVAVDVVNFGEEAMNTEKLEALIGAVNSSDNSTLVTIPGAGHILTDMIVATRIVTGDTAPIGGGGGFGGDVGGGGFEMTGGVDPNLDPELAMALRVSLEEERRRQEAEEKAKQEAAGKEGGDGAAAAAGGDVEMTDAAPMEEDEEDEAALLARAMAMSMEGGAGGAAAGGADAPAAGGDDDEALARALAMSMGAPVSGGDDMVVDDPELARALAESMKDNVKEEPKESVENVVASLPGVDPNDERIKNLLSKDKKDEEKKE